MPQVTFDTYADGNPYRRDSIIVKDRQEIDGLDNFDGLSGTFVVEVKETSKTECELCSMIGGYCGNCDGSHWS